MILGYHDWWQALLNLVCARGLKIIGSPEIHVLLLQVLVSIDLCPGIHNAGEILVHLQHAAMRGKQHTRYMPPSLHAAKSLHFGHLGFPYYGTDSQPHANQKGKS